MKEKIPKNFKGEKHCCVHAEQRAIMDALKRTETELVGCNLYLQELMKTAE